MTYNNAIKHINALPLQSVGGAEGVRSVCALLGSPQKNFPSILICGDAGKTSCAELLSSVLSENGHSVGCYSLSSADDVREQIKVGGKPILHAEFARLAKSVFDIIEGNGELLISQAEMIFTVALTYFAECGCDAVILERRLAKDSTPIIGTPILSIITSVFDTVSPVPFEELIPKGTAEAVTCIQHKQIYASISEACAESGCRLSMPIYADLEINKISLFKTAFTYRGGSFSIGTFAPCQLLNAITVIESAHALSRLGFNISEESVRHGLDRAHLPLMCRVIAIDPTIIVATVSNPRQLETLVASLAQVGEFLAGGLDIFVSPEAAELTGDLVSKLASCSIDCRTPAVLAPIYSPDLRDQVREAVSMITSKGDHPSAAVFIGSGAYPAELIQQIQKDLENITW